MVMKTLLVISVFILTGFFNFTNAQNSNPNRVRSQSEMNEIAVGIMRKPLVEKVIKISNYLNSKSYLTKSDVALRDYLREKVIYLSNEQEPNYNSIPECKERIDYYYAVSEAIDDWLRNAPAY